jgi:hypothetical protein
MKIMTSMEDLYDSIEMGFDPDKVKRRQAERRRRKREEERKEMKARRRARRNERLWQFFIAVAAALTAGLILWLVTEQFRE